MASPIANKTPEEIKAWKKKISDARRRAARESMKWADERPIKEKTCTVCNKRKPVKEFPSAYGRAMSLNDELRHYYRPYCKECDAKSTKEYIKRQRKENPVEHRKRRKRAWTKSNKRRAGKKINSERRPTIYLDPWDLIAWVGTKVEINYNGEYEFAAADQSIVRALKRSIIDNRISIKVAERAVAHFGTPGDLSSIYPGL